MSGKYNFIFLEYLRYLKGHAPKGLFIYLEVQFNIAKWTIEYLFISVKFIFFRLLHIFGVMR